MENEVRKQIEAKMSEVLNLIFRNRDRLDTYLKKDLTMAQAAVLVLMDKQEWMTAEAMWQEVLRRGLYVSNARDPLGMFIHQLKWDMKNYADDPRIVCRGGKYGLAHFLDGPER